ncbi:LLM class flavin-dependent oxidoreductase, partial [Desertihabitans aurantiacus]|uniref:LLM class flavin-dependent oxidoreductase n=1 Tax=Desertihabitans aurantiacus TaxID=2282477 RepID=UPI000DF7707E
MPELGVIIPPDQPPERFLQTAVDAEHAGLDEVWVWEDCFAEAGVATAAAVLARTERVRVGIGLLPVPLRNVALTAMELATLARLFPDRLLPGIGHGVLDWMGQVGARAASPTTLLQEYTETLGALLTGQEVSTQGRYVELDRVRLRWPPAGRLPLLVGARGPRTLALAGALGDGVIIDDADLGTVVPAVAAVREARAAAGR